MPSLRCTLSAYGYIGTDCLSASRDNRCLGQVCYAAAEICLRVESMPVPIQGESGHGNRSRRHGDDEYSQRH